jgi:hypothetical protein
LTALQIIKMNTNFKDCSPIVRGAAIFPFNTSEVTMKIRNIIAVSIFSLLALAPSIACASRSVSYITNLTYTYQNSASTSYLNTSDSDRVTGYIFFNAAGAGSFTFTIQFSPDGTHWATVATTTVSNPANGSSIVINAQGRSANVRLCITNAAQIVPITTALTF